MLFVTGIQAQKIDVRLTDLLPNTDGTSKAKSAMRGQQQEIDTTAVKNEINVSFNSDCTVKSFSAFAMVKEGYNCPTAELQELGVEIREKIGRMLILTIPAESLLKLGDIEAIESVNADKINRIMNENGRLKSRVSEVATEEMAVTKNHLPQAYTGKNVLVGIIDGGIDFNHAAFRNADGSTRIKMALRKSGDEFLEFTTDSRRRQGVRGDALRRRGARKGLTHTEVATVRGVVCYAHWQKQTLCRLSRRCSTTPRLKGNLV